MLPGDAINCVYRGPHSSRRETRSSCRRPRFFEANVDDGDEDSEEDLANDFESILDLMKSSGAFTAQSLRWHYRSRHEHLIAYSNASFYYSRLVTFPGAVAESANAGVRYFKSTASIGDRPGRDNPIERARRRPCAASLHDPTRQEPRVVAFSLRNATHRSGRRAGRSDRPDLDAHFDDDRVSGFFVKSLESVQATNAT